MAAPVTIGVDVGSTSIRVTETQHTKQGPSVARTASADLPAGAVKSGTVQDADAVSTVLREMWEANRFSTKNVVLGVNSPQIVVREITLPKLAPRDLRQALPFQVRDVLPMPAERALLDFYPLEAGGPDSVRGLLMAAPKDDVLTLVGAVQRARLSVKAVDLAPLALLRATATMSTRVQVIVDFGATVSTIVIQVDGEPRMVRTVSRGGDSITDSLATSLDVSRPTAEELKCRVGLAEDSVGAIVRDAIRPLIGEIRSSLAYIRDAAALDTTLLVTGRASLLPGLTGLLRHELGVEVAAVDLGAYTTSPCDPEASSAVSVGLTIGASS